MVGIGAVCEQLGLTPRASRYYEDQGLVETRPRIGVKVVDSASLDRSRCHAFILDPSGS